MIDAAVKMGRLDAHLLDAANAGAGERTAARMLRTTMP